MWKSVWINIEFFFFFCSFPFTGRVKYFIFIMGWHFDYLFPIFGYYIIQFWISTIRFLDIFISRYCDITITDIQYYLFDIHKPLSRFLDIPKWNYEYPKISEFWMSMDWFLDIHKFNFWISINQFIDIRGLLAEPLKSIITYNFVSTWVKTYRAFIVLIKPIFIKKSYILANRLSLVSHFPKCFPSIPNFWITKCFRWS